VPPYHQGEEIRNWSAEAPCRILLPYGADCKLLSERTLGRAQKEYLSPFKTLLENRHSFGNQTFKELGRGWYEFERMNANKYATPYFLTFPHIATHGHFVFVAEPRIFGRHPQVIKLPPSRTEEDHYLLAGVLNSSTSLFWLKQVCFNKGAGDEEERDRFEFGGAKVQELPLPEAVVTALGGKKSDQAERLTTLSRECSDRGRQCPALGMKKVLEKPGEQYHEWDSTLPGYLAADRRIGTPFRSADELRAALDRAMKLREQMRVEMIARQEEMDWLVYAAYGLIPDSGSPLADSDLSLSREQRPFCLWSQAEGNFERAVKLIPEEWSAPRRALWEARLRLIRDNEHVRRIEQPVYKRRWDEQWKIGNCWHCGQAAYDAEFLDAFHWWLSEKAEFWLEAQQGGAVPLPEWTAGLWSDTRVQAAWEVAAETAHRLEEWKVQQAEVPSAVPSRPDASAGAFAKFFKALVKEQSVPEGIPFARSWEELEKTMRVPGNVKRIRGRLNVPRERFWTDGAGDYQVARFA
jgi:hypothetical protein